MADLRQLIIDQLLLILQSASSGGTAIPVYHNRGVVPSDMRPAIVLLDGGEIARRVGPNKSVMPPTMVTMVPQIFYLAVENPPTNEGKGEELNAVRVQIIKAICTDMDLTNLIGGPRGGGRVQYVRCETDMKTGSSMRGELQLFFEIDYDIHPAHL